MERDDPALMEKKIDSENSSSSGVQPAQVEHADGRLIAAEDEAYERARKEPQDNRPIYVIFSPTDRDNPRNWSKAKKWYITCFASLLNVLT